LVTDIIADLILGRVIDDKLCKGWFVHETVSKIVATIASRTEPMLDGAEIHSDAQGRLEKFGLLSAGLDDMDNNSPAQRQSTFWAWFWMILQWIYLAFLSLRFILVGVLHARRLPQRFGGDTVKTPPRMRSSNSTTATTLAPGGNDRSSHLVLNFRIFAAVSTLLNLSRRMPWLEGSFCFVQQALTSRETRNGPPDSLLDK
jgi:hypothetical protein